MALPQAPFFTGGGAEHDAAQVRLLLRSIFGDQGGVIGTNALRVRATTPPSDTVLIGDGQVVVVGRVSPWQGVYTAANIGDEELAVPSTGGSPRKDLVVIRVEDPQFEGSLDPTTDNIIYPMLISNVPNGTETLEDADEAGMTATPLARIEIPSSTSTITDAMIFNVSAFPGKGAIGNIARPRTEYYQDSIQSPLGSGQTDVQNAALNTWENWPDAATLSVWVPPWANRADISVLLFAILSDASPTGLIRITVNGNAGDSDSGYNTVDNSSTVLGTAATFDVSDYQGQNVTVRVQAQRTGGTGTTPRIRATEFSSYKFSVFFREAAQF